MKKSILLLGAIAAASIFVSCDKDNGGGDSSRIDPSTICKENLVAYFPFENDATEQITGTAPSKSGSAVAYTAGRRGQALKGAENGYLYYSLPNLGKSLSGFSFAMWLTEPVHKNEDVPVPSFFQLLSSDFWGDICFVTDRRDDDALAIKTFHRTYGTDGTTAIGDRWQETNQQYENQYIWGTVFPVNNWFHIVVSYDATTSEIHFYVNGACVDSQMKNSEGEPLFNPACVNYDATPMGALNITSKELLINGWKQKVFDSATDEWMGWMKGAMDEFRLYNKGLSATEVSDLFKAEVSQIQ